MSFTGRNERRRPHCCFFGVAGFVIAFTFVLLLAVEDEAFAYRVVDASCPQTPSNGEEIISRAATAALGTVYCYGRESWTPLAGSGWGPDCSGLVQKSWMVPDTLWYKEEDNTFGSTCTPIEDNLELGSNRYQASSFYTAATYWSQPTWSSRVQGDAASNYNHVVLIQYPNYPSQGYDTIYEAPGTGLPIRRVSGYNTGGMNIAHRTNLESRPAHDIVLDNPTAAMTGPDGVFGWRHSTNPLTPYYGEGYQYLNGSDSGSARWVPWIEKAGYYDVWVRYTYATSRTQYAVYTIYCDGSVATYTVNQRTNPGNNGWKYIGLYRFAYRFSPSSNSIYVSAPTSDGGNIVADAVRLCWFSN